MPQHPQAKNVHERIPFKAFVEIDFSADRRHADAIAIMRDARDHAGEQPAILMNLLFPVSGLTRSLPLTRPNGLPVYVARLPSAPFRFPVFRDRPEAQ